MPQTPAAPGRLECLLRLNELLRDQADDKSIARAVTELLGRHLQADHCGYGEVDASKDVFVVEHDWTDGGMSGISGRWRVDDFGPAIAAELRGGRAIRLNDTLSDPRTIGFRVTFAAIGNIRSGIAVPLMKNGRFVAALYAYQTAPRDWSDEEEALLLQAAERTWAAIQKARAEAALKESEARLELATQAAGIGIWDWDLRSNKFVYSSKAKAICGFAPDRPVTYEDAIRVTHPDDLPLTSAQGKRARDPEIRDQSPFRYRIIRPDGEIRHVLAFGKAVFEKVEGKERAVRYVGTLQDITDNILLEREKAASEARLKLALEASRLAVWEVDLETGAIESSEELNRILGFPKDHKPSLNEVRARYYPGERERLQELGRMAEERGDRFLEAEFRYLWPNDEVRWLRLRTNIHLDAQSRRPGKIMGVIMDVTERKRVEEALRESEKRIQRAHEAAGVGDWEWDVPSGNLKLSKSYARLLGLTPETLPKTANDFLSLICPEDWERIRKAIQPLLSGRQNRLETEFAICRGDGTRCWLASRAEVEKRLPDGRPERLVGVNFDITARMKSEMAIRQLNETLELRVKERTAELAAANSKLLAQIQEREHIEATLTQMQRLEVVGQLTSGVAHDFNNLLTVILGQLDLLSRDVKDERMGRRIAMMRTAAERGAKLTSQLLAFSRRQKLNPKPVDLNDVLSGMSELLRGSLGGAVQLELKPKSGLWPAFADQTQLELVVLNLALNARDAMPLGGTLTIETRNVKVERPQDLEAGDYVAIAVSDTGTGMTEEVLEKAFEPFFTTKEPGKGSGLGLPQVYGFAKQSGGGVRINTRAGEGTCVEVYLPRASAKRSKTKERPRPAPRSIVGRPRVLLVDDDSQVREITRSVLEELGCEVLEAGSGGAALDLVRDDQGSIAAALVDFAMPAMNGADLARRLADLKPSLPVIFITGYANAEALAAIGDLPVVMKPFQPSQLAEKLLEAIEIRAFPSDVAAASGTTRLA